MSDLTAKFTDLKETLAAQASATDALVDTVEPKLQAIFDELDLILVNNAANTKAILAALGQSASCFPCPTPSIVVPPVDTTVNPIDSDHCKRSQWIIAAIARILTNMDTLQSFNVVGTFNVINDAISEIIAAISAGDTIPLPSFPETVNIVGDYVSYAGERLFSGVSLMDQFAPLESDLITAVYVSTDAGSAQSAYNASIDSSGASNGAKLLFKAVAYNALWSYALDPASMPDLSGFDGGVCSFPSGTCYTLVGELVTVPAIPASEYGIVGSFGPFIAFDTVNSSSGEVVWDKPTFYAGDLDGWTIETLVDHSQVQYRAGGIEDAGGFAFTTPQAVDGIPGALPSGTGSFHIRNGAAFTVRICKS